MLDSSSDRTSWHALDAEEALDRFSTSVDGLTREEAEKRLAESGPNRLPLQRPPGLMRRLARQLHNLLIYALLAAAALSVLIGHATDAAVIMAVVVANTVIGFVQEGRAERALEAIRTMIDPRASAIRDGRRVTLPADEIVPGDLVLIEAGDRVPADLRLVRARNLRVEEAVLTGESVAVDKAVGAVDAKLPLGDRHCMAYSGTFVAAGQGTGVAVATGPGTELGRISGMIGGIKPLQTPLLAQMDRFARQITLIVLGASAAAFLFAVFARGYALEEAFMIVVGLAVAAIPEGLPAILTIALAVGVQRMAARNAIIRRLPAVETLGSVSVICSDKTGTLTRNEMTVRSLVSASGEQEVTGVGYVPEGVVTGAPLDPDLVRAAILCNDSELRRGADGWHVDGDPMEGALLVLAIKAGASPDEVRARHRRIDEIPFDACHRFMATLNDAAVPTIFLKGAPEPILELCAHERCGQSEAPIDRERWLRTADRLAARGERLLAFATHERPAGALTIDFADLEGATLLGLAGFIDPPREEAVDAVRRCRSAGIRVVMITGDHAVTAQEIARQLQLDEDPRVLTGQALDGLDRDGLREAAARTTVFARTSPEHKLRLVEALQADGQIVAMTGDGVNDAPALKRADVGIAMGQKGTEASKEAAQMVLADDNFASIAAAVVEGRTVYDNLRKVIGWTLPTNGGEALTILAAIALGLTLPITAIQILWINMVTAVALGLTLAFEPTEPGVMRRPPRPRSEGLISRSLLRRIAFVSVLMAAGAFGTWAWAGWRGLPLESARTLVVNAIVVMEIFYLFSVRYTHGPSVTLTGILGTRAVLLGVGLVVLAQLLFTYAAPIQAVFATADVPFLDGGFVILVGIVLLLLVEGEKWLGRRLADRRP